ncbi:hypothetical protein GN956_G3963 [Arapaima gigas]
MIAATVHSSTRFLRPAIRVSRSRAVPIVSCGREEKEKARAPLPSRGHCPLSHKAAGSRRWQLDASGNRSNVILAPFSEKYEAEEIELPAVVRS